MKRPGLSPADWNRAMDLFDLLVQSNDPATLPQESNEAIRDTAMQLWQHHKAAAGQGFLDRPVEVQLAPVFADGQVLLDRFEVECLLGRGGMGEVYRAFDRTMSEPVALKTVARWLAGDERVRKRFVSEVQNARRVTHPNVCRIHEIFQESAAPFFVMELVKGRLLSACLADPAWPAGAVSRKQIVIQLAEGLQAAHENGVVHGDFKPANIMLAGSNADRPVIMDFGLARAFERNSPGAQPDLQGGSEEFMAPELRQGAAPSPASDIFAFGKVARQLAPKWESLWKLCTDADPHKRPASLKPVVAKLTVDMTRRYLLGAAAIVSAGAVYYGTWAGGRPKAEIPVGARILLNGFRTASENQAVARLTRSMTLTGLSQSARIHTVADLDLLPALRRIQRDAHLPVDGPILHQLLGALRASFWIDAELSEHGGRHSLELRILSVTGQIILAQTRFRDVGNVALLAEQAATWLRQTSGESLKSLQANPSTAQLSPVPEALEAYYDAMSHYAVAEMSLAEPLLEEAVRLDPNFAQAHSVLGITQMSAGQYQRAFDEAAKGLQLAARLPIRERGWIEVNYYTLEEDLVQTVESARRDLTFSPDEPRTNHLLAYALMRVGEASEAISFTRKAAELAPLQMLTRADLVFNLAEAGQYQDAVKEFRQAVQDGGLEDPGRRASRPSSDGWLYTAGGFAYLGLERYDEARAAFLRTPGDRDSAWSVQNVNAMQGRFPEIRTSVTEYLSGASAKDEVFQGHEFGCAIEAIAGNLPAARLHLAEMVNQQAFPPMVRFLDCAVFWASRLSDVESLNRAASTLDQIVSLWPNSYIRAVQTHARAIQAKLQNDVSTAERLLLQAAGAAFSVWALFDLADFYTQHNPTAAETYWSRLERYHGTLLGRWFPASVVLAWSGRAQAAHLTGQTQTARTYARKVLDHWGVSNPAIEPVQAAHRIHG